MSYYKWLYKAIEKRQKENWRRFSGACGRRGPFKLEREIVAKMVGDQVAGNYRLSMCDENEDFCVDYVGRSDKQLMERICDHISEGYKTFVWRPQNTAEEAYKQECAEFHNFGGDIGLLKNDKDEGHPNSPEGLKLKCSICGK